MINVVLIDAEEEWLPDGLRSCRCCALFFFFAAADVLVLVLVLVVVLFLFFPVVLVLFLWLPEVVSVGTARKSILPGVVSFTGTRLLSVDTGVGAGCVFFLRFGGSLHS